jgi:hypothetical protein
VRQIAVDRVLTYEEREFDCGEERAQSGMPQRCAFTARRQVCALGIAPGIAETYGHDCHPALVVEDCAIERQPYAQSVTAAVVKRKPALMGANSWRLTDDQELGGWSTAQ